MTENQRIEYKRELTDNLEKEVVAFLNAREGGVLYIGIDDDGRPRNQELMRDLEIVEHLGSGVPRILKAYGQQAFEIRESYLRVIFPYAQPIAPTNLIKPTSGLESGPESGPESIRQRVLQELAQRDLSKSGLAQAIGQKSVSGKLNERIREMLADGLIEYTIPGKPNSRLQKYRITGNGRALLNTLNKAK